MTKSTISTSCAAEIKQASQKQGTFKRNFALNQHGYVIAPRDPLVKPEFAGAFMLTDTSDPEEGYAIVGDDRDELINEAYRHLLA